MKNANTVTLTQDALTAIIAQAVAQALSAQAVPAPAKAETKGPKAAPAKAAKKAADAQAKRDAHLARVARWDELSGRSFDEVIALTASRIQANRAAGVSNPNIAPDDIRFHLTTDEHQALRRATWKAADAPAGMFDVVRDALVKAVNAAPAKRARVKKAAK